MNVIDTLDGTLPSGATAAALGLFDGIHRGHRAVIDAALSQQQNGLIPCVFTFTTNMSVPHSKSNFSLLQSEFQKKELLSKMGVQWMISPPFEMIRSLSPKEFFEEILIRKLGAKFISSGADFHFGSGASGDTADLLRLCEEHGVSYETIPTLLDGGVPISSSRIRKAVWEGDMQTARNLLGRPFSIQSSVIHGRKIGRTIGCPTVNQRFPKGSIIPKFGVYATVLTLRQGRFIGATNVGVKPTVGSDEILAETLIVDFSGDVYDEVITTEFHDFIRPEKQFESLAELSKEILQNANSAAIICEKYR